MDAIKKRVFYLEMALKKVWKEYNRLKKSLDITESWENKPLKDLKEEQ